MPGRHGSIAERFWPKVDKRPDGGCWLWTAGLRESGYGAFKVGTGMQRQAHRIAYELLVGSIPAGFQLDHMCHNEDLMCTGRGRDCLHRRCVNPAHLKPVTSRENLLNGHTITASKAAQTHCIHGHEFTLENTRVRKNGTRNCRTCNAIWDQLRQPRGGR